jgi:hypothetical protein
MNGNARTVERRIRVWIVQQERNRRNEGQTGRIKGRLDGPVEQRRRVSTLRQRKQWQ